MIASGFVSRARKGYGVTMKGLLIFLMLFVGAPLVELYLLIEVGSRIGAFPTIALCLFTAALGGLLVRWQGLQVLLRVRDSLQRREAPAIELLEGAAILVAGVLLLLPGFVTDTVGYLLLIPPLRRAAIMFLLRRRDFLQPASDVRVYSARDSETRIIEIRNHSED